MSNKLSIEFSKEEKNVIQAFDLPLSFWQKSEAGLLDGEEITGGRNLFRAIANAAKDERFDHPYRYGSGERIERGRKLLEDIEAKAVAAIDILHEKDKETALKSHPYIKLANEIREGLEGK